MSSTWRFLVGASKRRRAGSTAVRMAPRTSVFRVPSARAIPHLPLSLVSVVTSAAPASRSSRDRLHPVGGGEPVRPLDLLEADLGDDRELAGEEPDVAGLVVLVERDRPVGDLDVGHPVGAEELDELAEAAAPEEVLEEGAAEVVVDPRRAQDLELGVEVAGRQGRAPPELDQVDEVAVALDDVGEGAGRQPWVDHHGDPLGAGPALAERSCGVHSWRSSLVRWMAAPYGAPPFRSMTLRPQGERRARS